MNPDRYRAALIALAWILACALQVAAGAEKPAPVVDDAPVVVFPHADVKPAPKPEPVPEPDPHAVPLVAANELYVVTSTKPFRCAAVPESAVKLTEIEGPVKVNAVFHGGTGKRETKTFAGHVLLVEPLSKGRVELLLAFNGTDRPQPFTRQLIDIGVAPQPPPDDEDVEPEPGVASNLWIVNIDNRVKTDAATVGVLGNLAYWNGLKKAGHQFSNMQANETLDPRFTNPQVIANFADVVKRQGLPLTLILDNSPGKPHAELKLMRTPTSTAELDTIIKQLTGK